jgi:hypothetical protein
VVLPAAVAYYLTVASADNWSGAVCNLGRYVVPIAPLGVALVGIAVARTAHRRGAMVLVLTLASWTALLALALREDPHAANDSALLLAKSSFADGQQYVPGLFIRTWAAAAPGLWLRILAWLILIAAAALWLWRVANARAQDAAGSGAASGKAPGTSPLRTLAAVAAIVLLLGLGLEQTPGTRARPAWRGAIAADATTLLLLEGAAVVRTDEAVVGPGPLRLLVRAPEALRSLVLTMGGGGGFVHPAGRPPQALRPSGALVEVPLTAYHEVRGRDRSAVFSLGYLWLEQEAVLRPKSMEPGKDQLR